LGVVRVHGWGKSDGGWCGHDLHSSLFGSWDRRWEPGLPSWGVGPSI
jgi:hypothetical protein